ncbi:C40 family peptidase [Lysinibacillus sp. BW-2-10]|uniref:C40 family peptidase n=1 Tax=Lysinibacillus sp. BW-2-10 TaxID=2590030 RepID=UPI0011804FE4|nr:C40 family peptidase [Lysinibacillus sp. BW-2-10]TSI07354.1 peptidase [Lysinibacillus sp. BW-2-10]
MKKRWLLPVFATFMLLSGVYTNDAQAASPEELSTTAHKYIGIPYQYGGTTTNGFDCSGFTQRVFSDLGISLSRTSASQYAQGTAVSKSNLAAGDLVFFNTSGRGVSHVGIYLGDNKFINASTSKGVVVAKLSESYWAQRYIGAKRVATFTNEEVVVAAAEEVKSVAIDFSVYASRAEVAIQLAQALGLDTSDTSSTFPDVKSTDKFAGAVTALQKAGIFEGDQDGKFNPNSPITRESISKVLVVAFNLQLQNKTLSFTDVKENSWSYNYVNILASNGVTLGTGNGEFAPKDLVSLKQLDAFINRSMEIK